MLSDSDSESNDVHTLTINEHYAKAFQYKKEREELEKLKEKYGSDYSGSSESEDSEDSEDTDEDSDGDELTPAVDAAILRTLARIRKKDPAIYEGGRNVFEEEHTRTQDKAPVTKTKTKEKSKPLTIREAALASALADAGSRSPSPEPRPLTHTEEQRLLQSETRAAFHGAVGHEEEGDEDDLLVPRERTRDELELEEEEYQAFLEREVGGDLRELVTVDANEVAGDSQGSEEGAVTSDGDNEREGKKKKKGKKEREKEKASQEGKVDAEGKKAAKKTDKKSKEEADQDFLMKYIFNRGWIDRSSRRVPTYKEIVDSSSKSKSSKNKSVRAHADPEGDEGSDHDLEDGGEGDQGPTLSDEESFDDLAEAFETSYNFRFEEPDAALIPSFPRNLASARRESTTRKDARARKKERQEAEKRALLEARREEIRKERALVEAAVAEEEPENDVAAFAVDDDDNTSDKKKSKKQQKKEELARLKALKAKELRRKLEMVSAEGGLGDIGEDALAHLDLDADWDPSKHDAQMAELYGGDDDNVDGDVEKPTWDDDIDIDDIVPPSDTKSKADLKKQKKKDKKKKKKSDEEEEAGVDVDAMDADMDTGAGWDDWDEEDAEWKGNEEERKRKVDAYMDEVVNRLGFSGITSHMPTRFHYTTTAPENYGLTPTEILLATDAELNSYVGLKKMAPYRVDRGGKKKSWDPKRAERLKEFRDTLHGRVGSRYDGAWSLDASGGSKNRSMEARGEKKKRMGKKERARLRAALGEQGEDGEGEDDAGKSESRKRKRDSDVGSNAQAVGEEGEGEESMNKKKRRRRHKKGNGEVAVS